MNQLNALFCPDTSLTTLQISQELLFFDTFFYYQPTEVEQGEANENEPLCQGYAPVPFHDQLQRFKQLIRELKGNEAEFYSAQLSSMASNYTEKRDEGTVTNLISSICGKNIPQKNTDPNHREDLWQARLILQLAQILSQEEQELQKELTAIEGKKAALLDMLKGENTEGFSLPPAFSHNFSQVKPEIILKAWAKLFTEDPRQDEHRLLHCALQDYADIFFESNEGLSQQRPIRLFRIPLPFTHGMTLDDFMTKRNTFRKNNFDIIAAFSTQMVKTAENGLQHNTLKDCTALAAEWTRQLAVSGPWGHDRSPLSSRNDLGEPHLEVYICNQSPRRLCQNIGRVKSHIDEKDHKAALISFTSTKPSTCKG